MSAEEAKAYGLIDSVFSPRRKDLVPEAAIAAQAASGTHG
jgi:hypothetical protein